MFGIGSKRRPVVATDRAKQALGVKADEVEALGYVAVAQALTTQVAEQPVGVPVTQENVEDQPVVTEVAERPAPRPTFPISPERHLKYAERIVQQMDADEAQIEQQIAEEMAAHANKIAELKAQLQQVRVTRSFYQMAPSVLAPEPVKAVAGSVAPQRRRGRKTSKASTPVREVADV